MTQAKTKTKTKTKVYKPGEHPHSQANLNREGRPKTYGTEKKQRYLSVTQEGWEGAQDAARASGFSSLSDLIEKLGRGDVTLHTP